MRSNSVTSCCFILKEIFRLRVVLLNKTQLNTPYYHHLSKRECYFGCCKSQTQASSSYFGLLALWRQNLNSVFFSLKPLQQLLIVQQINKYIYYHGINHPVPRTPSTISHHIQWLGVKIWVVLQLPYLQSPSLPFEDTKSFPKPLIVSHSQFRSSSHPTMACSWHQILSSLIFPPNTQRVIWLGKLLNSLQNPTASHFR